MKKIGKYGLLLLLFLLGWVLIPGALAVDLPSAPDSAVSTTPLATDSGAADSSSTDNGSADNGSNDNGSADNGSTDNGSNDNGSTDNGSTDNGSTDSGSTDNGSTDNGSTDNGSIDNGSTDNGSTDNGSTDNGSIDNGSIDNGSTDNGSNDSSSNDSSSTDNGSTDNGSADNGSNDNGSNDNGGLLQTRPSPVVLVRFDTPPTDAAAFPVGVSQEALTAWFADLRSGFTGYDAQGNAYDLVTDSWSLTQVNPDAAGLYYASASPLWELESGISCVLAEGVSLPQALCAVSIQAPGQPDINCFTQGRGSFLFPWILTPAQTAQFSSFSVQLKQDSGPWTAQTKGISLSSDYLHVSQTLFTKGSTYSLKVLYPGGSTGTLTFLCDASLLVVGYARGDRDGGDVGGGGSSSGSQPAPDGSSHHEHLPAPQTKPTLPVSPTPTPPAGTSTPPTESPLPPLPAFPTLLPPVTPGVTPVVSPISPEISSPNSPAPLPSDPAVRPTAAPAQPAASSSSLSVRSVSDGADAQDERAPQTQTPVAESYSPTQTVLSGLRLRDLCLREDRVVFGGTDWTVSIPSDTLLALGLEDHDTLSVSLVPGENGNFLFSAAVNGRPVTALPGAMLRLRYVPQAESAVLAVTDQDGSSFPDAVWDDGLLRFSAAKTGAYTVTETPPPHDPDLPGSMASLLPLTGGVLFSLGGIAVFRRRHNG